MMVCTEVKWLRPMSGGALLQALMKFWLHEGLGIPWPTDGQLVSQNVV